jgi:hypothetical protein
LSEQRADGSFRQGFHDQKASHGGGDGAKTLREGLGRPSRSRCPLPRPSGTLGAPFLAVDFVD